MISKVKCGAIKAFNACCKYLFKEGKDVEIVSSQGVRHNPELMASDFITYCMQQPNKSKSVMFHGILSFPIDEKISSLVAHQISTAYLSKLGFKSSAHCVVSHSEKKHFHLHCLSSFTDMYGQKVDDSWIGLRAKKIAQELTKEYNLIPAIKKDYTKTNFKNLRKDDKEKYRLHAIISNVLKISHSIDQFEDLLKLKNIEIQYKLKRGSNEIQGISFKSGEFCFKGSEIDRQFSYQNLIKCVEQNIPYHIINQTLEQKSIIKNNATLNNFLSLFSGVGGSNGSRSFHTNSPKIKHENEEDIKKRKKKDNSNDLNI